MRQRVDYDRIAHLYDEPLRDHPVDPDLLRFLGERPDLSPRGVRVLDIGCGTGKQLAADRRELADPMMVGIDPFRAMLRQAQERGPTCAWVHGDGARLPFSDESFDYVTSQFSYHHLLEKRSMIAATFRILRRGGRFAMTNLDPWSMTDWIVYTYFPAARERDQQDFLPVAEFARILAEVGFSNVQIRRQYRREEITLGGFLAYAAQRFRTSQLMAIDDNEYTSGIAALRKEIERCGEQVSVDSELCLVTVCGDRGP